MKSPTTDTILRGDDPTGHGYYGAKRGTRKHKGVDIVTVPRQDILAPFSGVITKFGYVYAKPKAGKPKMRYIEITADVYRTRLMYATLDKSLKIDDRVFVGDVIGIAQDIAGYWGGGMTNHIHMEIYKYGLLTDPEPLIT